MCKDLCWWHPYLYFKPDSSWASDLKLPDISTKLLNINMPQTLFFISSLKFASPGFYILVNGITHFFSFFFTTASFHILSCPISYLSASPVGFSFQTYPQSDHFHPYYLVQLVVVIFPLTPCPKPFFLQKSGSLRKDEF